MSEIKLFPNEENDFVDLVFIVLNHLKDKKESGIYQCPLGTYQEFYAARRTVFEKLKEYYQDLFKEWKNQKDIPNINFKSLEYIKKGREHILHFCYEIE